MRPAAKVSFKTSGVFCVILVSVSQESLRWDFIVIGSGFGGAVAAMRLAQKGYSVLILEEGRRWKDEDFPKSNWDVRRFLWAPLVRCFGIQAISWIPGVLVLHGKGVGGGSLVYGNTHLKPADGVFADPAWPRGLDWKSELDPHYLTARRMLGVTRNPLFEESEQALRRLGEQLGVAESFRSTDVAVYFDDQAREKDPYFAGQGPKRQPCTGCGACMIGCRVGAKNALSKNYLYFAEKWGARIEAGWRVDEIRPIDGGYMLKAAGTSGRTERSAVFRGTKVVVAAGVLGSLRLLFRCKEKTRTLPMLSDRLGWNVRTNGESLLGATALDGAKDYSKGIAIGASIQIDERTKIEAVKYPAGSDFMRLLAGPLTPEAPLGLRAVLLFIQFVRRLPAVWRLYRLRDWARGSVILLVMQSLDQSMRLRWSGWRQGLTGSVSLPSSFAVAQRSAKILARDIGGEPQNMLSEVLFGTPATAHILGGCPMGEGREDSVLGANHEVHGYPGLYVCDGSSVPCNLGVNPSLSITAMAERMASLIPAKDEAVLSRRELRLGPENA